MIQASLQLGCDVLLLHNDILYEFTLGTNRILYYWLETIGRSPYYSHAPQGVVLKLILIHWGSCWV
jgi:hypothetical protein